MLLPDRHSAIHRYHLFQVLTAIIDDPILMHSCFFKGGTAATMLGILDRFSVDLDFDLAAEANIPLIRSRLESIFPKLSLSIKDQSHRAIQYILHYDAPDKLRNTIKLDLIGNPTPASEYQSSYLPEIDRQVMTQSIPTIVANKLCTPFSRWEQKRLAGRDLYDIHYFLTHTKPYNSALIVERSGQQLPDFFTSLIKFIESKYTQTILDQDINQLLDPVYFKSIRLSLKENTLLALRLELARVSGKNN